MLKKTVAAATLGATTLLWASPVAAQELEGVDRTQAIMDNLWLVVAGALVFLMQAGFAFVEAGLTRAKNLANIMAKNLADMAVGVTMFFIVGWTIAYGSGGNDWVGGFGDLFFSESSDPDVLFDLSAGLTPATNFFFQVVFAATAVTIASGAMAERTKFTTYLVFAAVMTAIIYPVVVHWTWGGGLIAGIEIGDAVYSDFAGSTIVHLTGGVAALVGAALLGPRIGRYGDDGKPRAIPGHNIGYAVIGVFILWFGWLKPALKPVAQLPLGLKFMRNATTNCVAPPSPTMMFVADRSSSLMPVLTSCISTPSSSTRSNTLGPSVGIPPAQLIPL